MLLCECRIQQSRELTPLQLMGEPAIRAAEWWMKPVRMKVKDRSAGRQCDSEGVVEVYIMLVLGTVLLNAIFMFLEI